MTKKEYSEYLKDSRWSDKRLIILKRDEFKCSECGCEKNLHIHHKIYIKDKKPWEYDNGFLITLCKGCHFKWHKNNKVKRYVKKPIKKKSEPKYNISKRDKIVNDKWIKLKEKGINP